MEIKDLQTVNSVSTEFKGLPIVYNADAFTSDFLRRAAAKFREVFGRPMPKRKAKKQSDPVESTALTLEETADRMDLEREFYAALIAGTPETPVLMSWELTDRGKAVPCNEMGLKRLEGKILQDLYEFMRDHRLPKSPEIPTTKASQTISATTGAGSHTPETQQVESPTM